MSFTEASINDRRNSTERAIRNKLRRAARYTRVCGALAALICGGDYALKEPSAPAIAALPFLATAAWRKNRNATISATAQVNAYEMSVSLPGNQTDRFKRKALIVEDDKLREVTYTDKIASSYELEPAKFGMTEPATIVGAALSAVIGMSVVKNGIPSNPLDIAIDIPFVLAPAYYLYHGLHLGSTGLRMSIYQHQLDNIDGGPASLTTVGADF